MKNTDKNWGKNRVNKNVRQRNKSNKKISD